jgi:dolichol-phosphate mannosyltransferase
MNVARDVVAGRSAAALDLDPACDHSPQVAIVIPCFKVADSVARVIERIGPIARWIICVDDCSPDDVAAVIGRVAERDPRVLLVRHTTNQGVGGATCTGYREALKLGADIIVKLDGDGQMDPRLVPNLVSPIIRGEADYVKGNRFFSLETLHRMSATRVIGNAGLSFLSKLSTGYWDLFDPTNGYTAIEGRVAAALPLDRLSRQFFFESDMLFRLSTLRARVLDLPMRGLYEDESSNLSELHSLGSFPFLHARNLVKRIGYMYFLRGFSVASISLIAGLVFLAFGIAFGVSAWFDSRATGVVASAGTVMLAALPIILGIQLILSFLAHDVAMTPTRAIHRDMKSVTVMAEGMDQSGPDRPDAG